jgi:heme exporter protein D
MKFQFDSLADFIAMNGHGPFVWAAYAITLAALIFLVVSPVLQKKAFFKQQEKMQKIARQQLEGQGAD